mgnify:CR=1 FL=1
MNPYITGATIKQLREMKALTQAQLSELLGITAKAVSKWEQGRSYPDLLLLLPIANMFSVTLDELFGNTH